MFDDFLIRAMLASVGVALAAAPLGALWYGDAWRISAMQRHTPRCWALRFHSRYRPRFLRVYWWFLY